VNLTCEGHYLGFDEALEIYGVKFIKQNISGNLVDKDTMMLKIKAAQSERDRLSALLDEFSGDIVGNPSSHSKGLHNNSAQSLISKLLSAFEYYDSNPNPNSNTTMPSLFDGAPELNERGFQKMLSFYEVGKLRFQQVLDEDVYGISKQTPGRKTASVTTYTSAQLKVM